MKSRPPQDVTRKAKASFLLTHLFSSFYLIFNVTFILGVPVLRTAPNVFTFKSAKKMQNTSHPLPSETPQSKKRDIPLPWREDKGTAEPVPCAPAHSDRRAYLADEVHEEGMGLHLVFQLVKNDQGCVAKPRCFCPNTVMKQKVKKNLHKMKIPTF